MTESSVSDKVGGGKSVGMDTTPYQAHYPARRLSFQPRHAHDSPRRDDLAATSSSRPNWEHSASKDTRHLLALRELVDEFVEVSDLLHQRVRHLFDTYAAHHPFDEAYIRVQAGRLGKKSFEISLGIYDPLQLLTIVARQPRDDLIDFLLRPPLPFGLLHVERIHTCKRRREDAWFLVHDRELTRAVLLLKQLIHVG